MPINREPSGRPSGTETTNNGVVHYTCNPPDTKKGLKAGLRFVGRRFGVGKKEVVLIPDHLYKKTGRPKDTIGSEALLRDLK